ncbi:MAG: oligosaccharide flippase family protein [Ruminococcus flavefaciens]|nr:oligosaccharide flippase family protein [Ruminococcus flavefaciens]
MSNVKKNFIYSSIYQCFTILMPLITTPYLSRTLTAAGIGQYTYAYSVALYFTMFIKLGLNSYGNRTIAIVKNNKAVCSVTFWNIYTTQFVLGIIFTFIYLVYVLFVPEKKIIALIFIFFVISAALDITWFFYGLEDFKTITIRDMAIKIISVFCIFFFVKESGDIWKYTVIMALGFCLSQISLWPLLIKQVDWIMPSCREIVKHIKPNLILLIPTISISIYKTMDKIMLGGLAGEIEVGYYESCEKVIQVPMAFITALGNVMLPHMSFIYSEKNVDREVGIALIRKSEHLMMLVASVTSFGIMSVAREFVPTFYGDGFDRCIDLFYILLPSCIFLAFANIIRTQYLIPNKMDKEFIVSLLIGAMVNLGINIILIPQNQSIGAAVGTLAAEVSVCIVQICYVQGKIPILKIFTECIGYLLIAVLMFLMGRFMPVHTDTLVKKLIIKILVCGIFWFSLVTVYWICIYRYAKKIKKAHIGLKELLEKCISKRC